jgi:hypothetical protein
MGGATNLFRALFIEDPVVEQAGRGVGIRSSTPF